ncbi:Hydrogenase maturation factor HypB [BD1-7 clade bacterium]|uniref:Hydrogenase maturation factor HypB n=1 Tax=BD1-7 clade bacterium TaxID=2029982 RepID=A0A5S9QPF5_9GAMM|nr:Hydrogenase maturation factor HypB [BD1-7 clade bacterium]CAA0121063.1 Hydrogenase maturation factor HypB [BD1-7 clade bacterium]
MCTTCGCDGEKITLKPVHATSSETCAHADQRVYTPTTTLRKLNVGTSLMAANRAVADDNRDQLSRRNILAINLLSSPGAGKTSLLVKTLTDWQSPAPRQVIEGDQQTAHDAERIASTGTPALQINTGKGCHLDSRMIQSALQMQPASDNSVLFIENVGNLVCPANFDLGETHKVVILSVAEGDDKPLKYPDAFYHASLMIISKTDLLNYVDFDVDRCIQYARSINPGIKIIQLSVKDGSGLSDWHHWLDHQLEALHN